jgi:antitoxin component YwqK of YwqJK toxin-antitoxin module
MRHALKMVLAAGLLVAAGLGIDAGTGKTHRSYHDNGNLSSECPLDSQGRMNGDLRTYYPSGRLKGVVNMSHGSLGTGVIYSDERADETEIETEE